MSDTNTVPQGTDPSIAAPAVPAAPPPVVAPPKVDGEPEVRMTPAQLKARLDETRAAAEKRAAEQFAANLGVDLDTAKKLIADAKAKEDAEKAAIQKLTEQVAERDKRLAEFDVYKRAVEARAAHEFSLLSDAQKAAVEKAAGDSPAKRLEIIEAFRPTWQAAEEAKRAADEAAKAAAEKAAADAAKAAEAAKKTAPIPAPASTTPAAPPPPPQNPGTPTNHLAVWEAMKVSNPAAAAIYRVKHDAAIRAAQRQATG